MSTGYVPLDDVLARGVASTGTGPSAPRTIAEVGLASEFVSDLLIKMIYTSGPRTGQQLTDGVKLPFPIVDERLRDLQQRQFIEVRSTAGASRAGYTLDLSEGGRARAREALASNQYVGPAPVPLTQYRALVGGQGSRHAHVARLSVEGGFGWLVLNQETLD